MCHPPAHEHLPLSVVKLGGPQSLSTRREARSALKEMRPNMEEIGDKKSGQQALELMRSHSSGSAEAREKSKRNEDINSKVEA